jgi:hypothetical protein
MADGPASVTDHTACESSPSSVFHAIHIIIVTKERAIAHQCVSHSGDVDCPGYQVLRVPNHQEHHT